MGRFWFLLGFFLLFISCPLLIMAIMDPDDSPLGAAFVSIVCNPDEVIRSYSGPADSDGSRSVTFFCENASGDEREVTGYYVLLMIGVFAVPFVSGLTIVISTSNRMAKRKANEIVGQVWSQVDDGPEKRIQFESQGQPQSMKEVTDLLGHVMEGQKENLAKMGVSHNKDYDGDDDDDLSDKLRELKETFDQGLINKDEYEALRQEILRSFS